MSSNSVCLALMVLLAVVAGCSGLPREKRGIITDIWDRMLDTYKKAGSWLKEKFDMTLDRFKDLAPPALKKIVDTFLADINTFDMEGLNQFFNLFKFRKDDLGSEDWEKIKNATRDAKHDLISVE